MSHTPHRLLVVGVGSIGERHVRCFQKTDRVTVGIAETNATLRQTIAQRYSLADAFASLDEAIGKGFTLGLIATPAQLHVPMALRMIDAGMHVLIEKPLSIGLAGVDELARRAETKRATVGVAYVWRSSPALTAMRDAIRTGRFGKPVHATCVSGQHFPTYRPAYRDIYYKDRATGGGAIQDSLTHLLNAMEWLLGPITRLAADAAHQVLDGVTVEDTVNLLARHDHVLACYSHNQYQAPNETVITVVCQRGTARFEALDNRWRWKTDPNGEWEQESFGPMERDMLFIAQAHAFLDAVEGKHPIACTLDEGVQTLKVNLAALRSAESLRWESV